MLNTVRKPRLPLFLRFRSSTFLIISTVSIAVFTDIFLFSLIIPVIPFALENRIGISPEETQYAISVLLAAYAAGPIVASPFIGWIADRVKTRRSSLLAGLVCLVGATLLFCLGRSLTVYMVARLLQGITSAIVWIVGLALIADTVEESKIGRAMAIISIQLNLGLSLGPMLGGIVYATVGWFGVFALGFGFLALDIVMRMVMIEKRVAISFRGSSNLTQRRSLSPEGERRGSRSRTPGKIPEVFRLLKYPRMIAGMWLALTQATIISAFDAALPLHVNRLFGWTSFQAGLMYLAIAVPPFFIAPLSGWMSDRYGPKRPSLLGIGLTIPSLLLLRLPGGTGEHNPSQEAFLCVLLVLLSILWPSPPLISVDVALSLTSAPSISEISYISAEHGNGQLAQAYALFNMSFSAGFLLGPLWGGFVTEKAGWNIMVTSLSGLALVTLAPVTLWTGNPLSWRTRLNWRVVRLGNVGLRKGIDSRYMPKGRNALYYPLVDRRPKRVFDKETESIGLGEK